MNIPSHLFKVLSPEAWKKSQQGQILVLSDLDRDFIHLATQEQLAKVLEKFWANLDTVILKLDTSLLVGRLVKEKNPGGTQEYFHLYDGNVPVGSVVEVEELFLHNQRNGRRG